MSIKFNKTVGEVLEDMAHGVYDLTDNGKCTGCGACCSRYLPISKAEIKRIKRYVRENNIQPHVIPKVFGQPMVDHTCPFMRMDVSKERCMIYPVKPEICTEFICSNPAHGEHYQGGFDKMPVDMMDVFFG